MRKIVLLLVCVVLAVPLFGQTTLNGAGATFPNPMYSKWFSEYHKVHSDVQVNYSQDPEYSNRARRGSSCVQHSWRDWGSKIHARRFSGNFSGQDFKVE